MPAKVNKKVKPKRKQVKKTIRKKIQHKPAEEKQDLPYSLRQQLLMKGLLGYNPQQYGNINNQRRIDQIKQDNQTIAQEINDYKATIDSLRKEKEESKSKLKKIKSDYDAQEADLKSTKDKLAEATRVETETNRLRAQQQNLTQQLEETNSENAIIQYKTKNATIESNLNEAKLKNIELKLQMQENELYQKGKKLHVEFLTVLNENEGMVKAMKEPAFLNPNEALKETTKNLEKEKAIRKLLEEQRKKQEEYQLLKLHHDSMPSDEDLRPYVDQISDQIYDTNNNIMVIREAMYPHQKAIDDYNAHIDRRQKLDNQLLQLQMDRNILKAQGKSLPKDTENRIKWYNQQKIDLIAKQQYENKALQRQIEYNDKLTALNEENQIKKTELEYAKKGLSPDEQNTIKQIGQKEVENEEINEYIVVQNKEKDAERDLDKSKAKNDYYGSKEFNSLFEGIQESEYTAARMRAFKEQQDNLNKALENAKRAEMDYEISKESGKEDLSTTQQATFYADKYKDVMQEAQEKERVRLELNQWRDKRPDIWEKFVEINNLANRPDVDEFADYPIDMLRDMLSKFKVFFAQTTREEEANGTAPKITSKPPPVENTLADASFSLDDFLQSNQDNQSNGLLPDSITIQAPQIPNNITIQTPQPPNNIVIEEEEEHSDLDDFTG